MCGRMEGRDLSVCQLETGVDSAVNGVLLVSLFHKQDQEAFAQALESHRFCSKQTCPRWDTSPKAPKPNAKSLYCLLVLGRDHEVASDIRPSLPGPFPHSPLLAMNSVLLQ